MLAILPKLAPWPFARAGASVRKATRQAPLFGYALTGNAPTADFKVTDTYHPTGDSDAGWNAFDADGKTSWYPHNQYASAYLQLECTKARTIQSFYAFQDTSAGLHSGYLATTIKILASNDGTNYTQIANSSMTYAYDSVDTKVYVSQRVTIANPKAYKFYRISVAPTNHPYVCLAGLVLQEPLGTPVKGMVAQYRFIDKEAINEINEAFATLTGTFSVADGKLTTASNTTSYATMPKILFDDGEDFCIRVRQIFTASAPSENPIVSVWGDGSSVAWALWRNSNAGNKKIGFALNAASANGARLYTLGDVPDNKEVEIEVSRVNGTIYLFLDGVLQSSVAYTAGNTPSVQLPDTRTDVYGNAGATTRDGFYNGGQKGALQIYKGVGGHTASYTKGDALEIVTTPTYSTADQDNLVVNTALRRDNAINEVNDVTLVHSNSPANNAVRRGRIAQISNTNNYTAIRSDRFGDGDFTIECKFNINSVNSSTGGAILGEWFRSDQVNVNNRWAIFVNSSMQLQFYVGKIDATGIILQMNGPTLSTGVEYHIVMERVNGVLSMILNGNEVATAAFTAQLPGVAPYNVTTNSTSNYHSWSGEVWDIRIAKKALYNGMVARTPVLPKASRSRAVYTADEAKSIVIQYDFVGAREEKIGLFPTLSGTSASAAAMLINNTLTTTVSDQASFALPAEDFINDDFTIETTVSIDALSVANNTRYPILAKWTMGTANNSWSLAVNASKQLGFFVSPDGTFDNAVGAWVGSAITLGKEMHVVVECISRVVKIYVDTVAIGTINLPSKATVPSFATNANPITNVFADDSARRAAMTFKRIRIARKALFNGNVVKAKAWPRFARKNKRAHMTSGIASATTSGQTFNVYGSAQNLMYQTPAISIGSLSDTLFRTLDGKIKRLVALFSQTSSPQYFVLFDKDASAEPTNDMPLYTRVLSMNGNVFDLANFTTATVAEGFGATGKAWQTTAGFGPFLHIGRTSSFEFLPPATVVTIGTSFAPANPNVAFKGYMKDLTDVPDAGSLTNDLVLDIVNPRACKLYKIRGLWTQSNNYLCIGLETLATDSYANLEKQYPDIANIPRVGTALFSGEALAGKTFSSATTINQTPTGKNPYVQYYWSITAAEVNALNAGSTVNHYIG